MNRPMLDESPKRIVQEAANSRQGGIAPILIMKTLTTRFELKSSNVNQTQNELLISLAMKLRPQKVEAASLSELASLAVELIGIYDSPFRFSDDVRERAARAVARLAGMDKRVLEGLIVSAKRYAEEQHGADAFPYNPNSFDVLAIVQPAYECVVCFLREVIDQDSGVACYSATQALRVISATKEHQASANVFGDNSVLDPAATQCTDKGTGEVVDYFVGA